MIKISINIAIYYLVIFVQSSQKQTEC